jgi:sugar lactone lactonase YvrE
VGQGRRRALTFPLETPWEVSPYFNNYSMRFIEGGSRDLYFKPDGTKVYVVGERASGIGLTNDSEYVHEFSLSTPWNLNTVGYTTSVGVGTALETSSQGLFFKDDGTKMYVVGINSDRVYQYALSTPWSVSSASYENKNILVFAQDSAPRALYIGAAGTAMYIAGDNFDRIFQYTLGTAWDVSTATYTGNSYSVSSQENQLQSVWFKDDGTKMYVVGTQQDRVYQYTLSTPWNITTVSYDKKSYNVGSYGPSLEANPYGLAFKSDGSKFYIVGDGNHRITEIPLSVPWDLENSPVDNTFNTTIVSPTYGFDFKTYSVSTVEVDPLGLFFKSDGTTMYVVGQTSPTWAGAAGLTTGGDYVHQFSLGTAWDVNTVGYTTSFFVTHSSVAPAEFVPTDMYIGAAGTAMYILSDTANALYRYTLSTPWSVGTASTTVGITSISLNNLGISTTFRETTPTGLTFKPDGTKFYVLGTDKDTVFQYSLSTAWDITTASIERQFYMGFTEGTPQAIDFRSDGTYMYTIGSNGVLFEYVLSIPWDVSTAFYTSVAIQFDGGTRGLYLKSDGTKIYTVGLNADNVFQVDLKEPWKLFASASKALNISSGGVSLTPTGIELSPDLQRLYVVGTNRGLYRHDFNPT